MLINVGSVITPSSEQKAWYAAPVDPCDINTYVIEPGDACLVISKELLSTFVIKLTILSCKMTVVIVTLSIPAIDKYVRVL